jgi:DUF1680 family protein
MLPRDISLKAVPSAPPLDGVIALEGRAKTAVPSDWTDTLYREAESGAARDIDIRLIPYFAWDNRGKSEMSVWFPVMR